MNIKHNKPVTFTQLRHATHGEQRNTKSEVSKYQPEPA